MVTLEQAKASAVNGAAIKNAEGIIKKKKYKELSKSLDETYLHGVFSGSGKSDYVVYVDSLDGIKSKCSCPSRQFPCKHALALMFLGASGEITNIVDMPQDVLNKRDKKEKAKEKVKEKVESGLLSKNNIKKLDLLKEGLEFLSKSIEDILNKGLKKYKDNRNNELDKIYKILGDYKLTGTQGVFKGLLISINEEEYKESIKILIKLNEICKRGVWDIENQLNNKKVTINKESNLEALIATVRKQDELEALGLYKEQVSLLQLSLTIHNRGQENEIYKGVYLDVEDGKIYTTTGYSNIAMSTKVEDSILSPIQCNKIYIYPGKKFNRIRLGEFLKKRSNDFYKKALAYSNKDIEKAKKDIKGYFNSPLITEDGYFLIDFSEIFESKSSTYIKNKKGQALKLTDTKVLRYISLDFKEGALLVKVSKNMVEDKLEYKGLSIVNENGILHLSI